MLKRILAMLLFAAGVTSATAGPINVITNGSFEFGINDAIPGEWTMQGVGSTDLTGWSITRNNIDWGNSFWQAADGTHSLDLNGNMGPGGISQLINTTIGMQYNLTFSLSGNPNLGRERGVPGDLLVWLTAAAGATSADFYFDVLTTQTNANMAWAPQVLSFTASADTTLIQFASRTTAPSFPGFDFNCCYRPALDNVAVTAALAPVPEPSTIVIFGAALIGLMRIGRKRPR